VTIGRITACVAVVIATATAKPLLGNFDQAFQYIQEFTGFFTPGIVVIFVLGMFWKRATTASAMTAAIGSAALSLLFKLAWPELPFMNRVGLVFLLSLGAAIIVSLASPVQRAKNTITLQGVDYSTSGVFNIASVGVIVILIALYATWW
jgi:solute:Na+ symporter, SSS family